MEKYKKIYCDLEEGQYSYGDAMFNIAQSNETYDMDLKDIATTFYDLLTLYGDLSNLGEDEITEELIPLENKLTYMFENRLLELKEGIVEERR
jgi:hypothetical protein